VTRPLNIFPYNKGTPYYLKRSQCIYQWQADLFFHIFLEAKEEKNARLLQGVVEYKSCIHNLKI
jgi:hypothetical protein